MRTFLRSSSEVEPATDEARLRELRIEAARRNSSWTEVAETDLVKRGRLLVHADTDELHKLYRGAVFARGETRPTFNEQVPLVFYVSHDGGIVFLERTPAPGARSSRSEHGGRWHEPHRSRQRGRSRHSTHFRLVSTAPTSSPDRGAGRSTSRTSGAGSGGQ